MPSPLTPAETLKVERHIKRIEDLSKKLSTASASIYQKILTEWSQALDQVRGGHRVIAALSPDAQKVVVHARSVLSRDRKHFSNLEQSGWKLPLDKLIETFGCAALVSHDFIEKLALLARKTEGIIDWDDAWDALSAARSTRQTRSGRSFQRGIDRSRDWVPSDLDKAAADLGQSPLKGVKKARKDDAHDSAEQVLPDAPSPEQARRGSAPPSEHAALYDESPAHVHGSSRDGSPEPSLSSDALTSTSVNARLPNLDAHADEWDESMSGVHSLAEDTKVVMQPPGNDADARFTSKLPDRHSSRHHLLKRPMNMESGAFVDHPVRTAACRSQLVTVAAERRVHHDESPETQIRSSSGELDVTSTSGFLRHSARTGLQQSSLGTSPVAHRPSGKHRHSSILSGAGQVSSPGPFNISNLDHTAEVNEQLSSASTPKCSVPPAETRPLPNLDDTLKRLSGDMDNGCLAHQSFDHIFRAVLPPRLRYLEVPDYCSSLDQLDQWSTWAATTFRDTGFDGYCSIVYITQRRHWVLLFASTIDREVHEYDSIATDDFTLEPAARHIVTRLGGNWEQDAWSYHRAPTPTQQDSSSCGIYAIACALFTASGMAIPRAVNSNLWRAALRASLSHDGSLITLPAQEPSQAPGHDLARAQTLRESVAQIEVTASVFQNLLSYTESSKSQVSLDLAAEKKRVARDEAILPTLAMNCQEEVGKEGCSCDDGAVQEPPKAAMAYAHYQYVVRLRREQRQLWRYQGSADNIDDKLAALSRVLRSLDAWKTQAADDLASEEQQLLKAREGYEEVERENKRKKEVIDEFLAGSKRARR